MPSIAVMQGRLVPPVGGSLRFFPVGRWKDEFSLAASAGLDSIEWIFDLHGEAVNPLGSDSGVAEMLALSRETGTRVCSLCANYLMDRPFLRADPTEVAAWIPRMAWLLDRCSTAGISRIVLPFLDESRIESEYEASQVLQMLQMFLPFAEKSGISLHLETSLPPNSLAKFLERCSHPLIRITFDCGNSASLGYFPYDEFAAYGSRIGSVHIKDRRRAGGTVPPGTGDVDFSSVFSGLSKLNYLGDFVLEIARPESGSELEWIKHYRHWVANQIEAAWNAPK